MSALQEAFSHSPQEREQPPKRVIFAFTGQGSQYPGMSELVCSFSGAAKEVYKTADELLGPRFNGRTLSEVCKEGPAELLRQTWVTQPALFTTSVAMFEALKEKFGDQLRHLAPVFMGHSAGEYAALVAADVLNFSNALALIAMRGKLMHEAGEERPGSMAAILGGNEAVIEGICLGKNTQNEPVAIANYNAPGQHVISGDPEKVKQVGEAAIASGAARVVALNISLAAHSPFMQKAAEKFGEFAEKFPFRDATTPIYPNSTAEPTTSGRLLQNLLPKQLTLPVWWYKSVLASGAAALIELGPGAVLANLTDKIDIGVEGISFDRMLAQWKKTGELLLPAKLQKAVV